MRPYVPVRARACVCVAQLRVSNYGACRSIRGDKVARREREREKKRSFVVFGSELIAWPIPLVDFTGNERQKKHGGGR